MARDQHNQTSDDARCVYCHGTGIIRSEAVGLAYICPRCDGAGIPLTSRSKVYKSEDRP